MHAAWLTAERPESAAHFLARWIRAGTHAVGSRARSVARGLGRLVFRSPPTDPDLARAIGQALLRSFRIHRDDAATQEVAALALANLAKNADPTALLPLSATLLDLWVDALALAPTELARDAASPPASLLVALLEALEVWAAHVLAAHPHERFLSPLDRLRGALHTLARRARAVAVQRAALFALQALELLPDPVLANEEDGRRDDDDDLGDDAAGDAAGDGGVAHGSDEIATDDPRGRSRGHSAKGHGGISGGGGGGGGGNERAEGRASTLPPRLPAGEPRSSAPPRTTGSSRASASAAWDRAILEDPPRLLRWAVRASLPLLHDPAAGVTVRSSLGFDWPWPCLLALRHAPPAALRTVPGDLRDAFIQVLAVCLHDDDDDDAAVGESRSHHPLTQAIDWLLDALPPLLRALRREPDLWVSLDPRDRRGTRVGPDGLSPHTDRMLRRALGRLVRSETHEAAARSAALLLEALDAR